MNPDVTATLRAAIAKIHALPRAPIRAVCRSDAPVGAEESDTPQWSPGSRPLCSTCPANTTCRTTTARVISSFREGHEGCRLGIFDQAGVHFIGLVNVTDPKAEDGHPSAPSSRMAGADVKPPRAARRLWCSRTSRWPFIRGGGHRRQRPCVLSETIRIGLGAERPHSSGDAKVEGT